MIAFALLVGSLNAACVKPVASCNPSNDYFADLLPTFNHSTSILSLSSANTYINLTMKVSASGTTQEYALLQCGCPDPGLGPSVVVISVPVGSMYVGQKTTIPKVTAIGQSASIRYIEDQSMTSTESVIQQLSTNLTTSIGSNYALLSNAPPDAIVTGPGQISQNGANNPSWYNQPYTGLLEGRRFIDTDSLENSPLARAELIKVFGMLFGIPETARALFSSIENNYMSTVKVVQQSATRRPTIIRGFPNNGQWAIDWRNGYYGQLINDAGANFVAAEDVTSQLVPSAAFAQFNENAQFWIDATTASPNNAPMTEQTLLGGQASKAPGGDSAYFGNFAALKCKGVYSNDNQLSRNGNQIFEQGLLKPDVILNDLAQIFHPETFSASSLFYYRPLTPNGNSNAACPYNTLPIHPTDGSVTIVQAYNVTGINPNYFNDQINTYVAPQIASLFGLQPSNVDVYVKNQLSDADPGFTCQVAINCDASQTNVVANQMATSLVPQIEEIIGNSLAQFQQSKTAANSIVSRSTQGGLAAFPQGRIYVYFSDGSTTEFTLPPTLPIGAIIGISVGCLVAFCLIVGGISLFAYRNGSDKAYQQIQMVDADMESKRLGSTAKPEVYV